MMSASAVINNILVEASDYVTEQHMNDLKMILYMNLCDYTFVKNEDSRDLIESQDVTYEIIRDWHNQLIIEGKTSGTILQYGLALKKLLEYTGMNVTEINERHIKSFLSYGKLRLHWKDKTYNSKVRYLRQFFSWAYDYDVITENPMKRVTETKEEYRMGFVLLPEQREIYRCCCRTERELAIVDLLYSTGGRISEICQLNRDSVDFYNKCMVIYGKGRKERVIDFSPQALVHMENYLKTRDDNDPALFVSSKRPHNRLTKAGVSWIIKDIQSRDERLKGLKISPHTFRRTCGTDMLNHGAPLELVKEKLGHEKADTTLQCYARVSRESMKEANRKYCFA